MTIMEMLHKAQRAAALYILTHMPICLTDEARTLWEATDAGLDCLMDIIVELEAAAEAAGHDPTMPEGTRRMYEEANTRKALYVGDLERATMLADAVSVFSDHRINLTYTEAASILFK